MRGLAASTYQVSLVGGGLEFLVDPDLRFVAVALKHLELVGLGEPEPARRRALVQGVASLQQL